MPFLLTGTGKDFFDAVFIYTWLYVGGGQGWIFKVQQMSSFAIHARSSDGPAGDFHGGRGLVVLAQRGLVRRQARRCWFVAGWLGIIAAGRFFAHYYVMLFPMMALLVPAGIVYVRDRWQTRPSRMFRLVSARAQP